jgi:hypothetical protein
VAHRQRCWNAGAAVPSTLISHKETHMKILTTLAATTVLTTLAFAQGDPATEQEPSPPAVKVTFEALDRNADQRLSKTEAAADDTVSSQFVSLDADADGYLNRREYNGASRPMPPRPGDTDPPLPGPG